MSDTDFKVKFLLSQVRISKQLNYTKCQVEELLVLLTNGGECNE